MMKQNPFTPHLLSFVIFHLLFFIASASAIAQEYKMSGPYEVVARDGEFRGSKNGSERDMKAAWDFAREGKHDEARRIIDAYAETLQRLDGHDAPLCLIQGYWLCRAMMIEKELAPHSAPEGATAPSNAVNQSTEALSGAVGGEPVLGRPCSAGRWYRRWISLRRTALMPTATGAPS